MSEALVLLVLLWAALLIPSALRSRHTSPHATVGGFERAMDVLRSDAHRSLGGRDASPGRQVLVPGDAGRIVEHDPLGEAAGPVVRPRAEDPVIVRRRTWFVRSVLATTSLLLLAVIAGGWLWFPALAVTGLTAGYVVTLRRLKLQRDEARRVVRELELDRAQAPSPDQVAVGSGWESGTVRLRRWDD